MGKDKKQVKTSDKVVRNEKGQIVSGTPNPYGRPTGAESFSTKWKKAVEKIAKMNNTTEEEIEMQLLLVGFKKAKDGDYRFYQDIFDRVYGKPKQSLDHTTLGQAINSNEIVFKDFTKKDETNSKQ